MLNSNLEFLLIEALLELLANMLPPLGDKRKRKAFLDELDAGLSMDARFKSEIKSLLEGVSVEDDWQTVCLVSVKLQIVIKTRPKVASGIFSTLASTDIAKWALIRHASQAYADDASPQSITVDKFETCGLTYRQRPPHNRIFVDKFSLLANIPDEVCRLLLSYLVMNCSLYSLQQAELDTFVVPFTIMTNIETLILEQGE